MLPFHRTIAISLLFVLAHGLALHAQDMPVRVEAIRLMERANAVSLPAMLSNYKQEVTFRTHGLDGIIKEGQFTGIYGRDSERYEYVFGSYHMIHISFPDRIVQSEYQPPPPETLELDELTPIRLGRFDKSDTIHSITPATLFGRSAKCIQFETVNGRTRHANEICVDAELGTLVRWNVEDELIENTEFFHFEGTFFPARIRHYVKGKLRMEVEQRFTVIQGPIDWAALTPPNPEVLEACEQYRRPTVRSAPQPVTAGPGPWFDVRVHSVIGEDGHVYDASVLPAGRADLEQEALRIVSGWSFSPALCNGKAFSVNADLTVHFPPQ